MKKITILLFLITFFNKAVIVQAQTFQWAKGFLGSSGTIGYSLAIDSNKNVYTLGDFSGTTDFDPGTNVSNLNAINSDIFITKLDASGNFIWAKQMGGIGVNYGSVIIVDASNNIYITGYFNSTVDFDPEAGTYNLTPNNVGTNNTFITKLDSNGNFIWAKQFGSTISNQPSALAIDASGNIVITGNFSGTADFDPSTNATTNSISNGQDDIFITKLDALGNFVWAKTIGSAGLDYAGGLVVDNSENIYLTGRFSGTVDFDPNSGVSNLISFSNTTDSSYVLKLDSSGNYSWAKRFTGTVAGTLSAGVNITLDNSNNVYTTGIFRGSIDFDPDLGVATLGSAGVSNDVYISKLNSSGSYLWAKKISGNLPKISSSIILDNNNNVYTIGSFSGVVNFNPNGTDNINANGNNVFINKLDNSGNYINTKIIGSAVGSSVPPDISASPGIIDKSNNTIYITGYYKSLVDFDPDAGESILGSIAYPSAYTFKYGATTLGLEDYNVTNKLYFTAYPNPNKGQFHITVDQFEGNATIEISNILGQKLYSHKLNPQSLEMDFNFNKGIYFVNLTKDKGKKSVQKIIIE